MRTLLCLFLFLCMSASARAVDYPLYMRSSDSFTSSTTWEQTGNLLLERSSGEVTARMPMRRHYNGRDEGCVRKVSLNSSYSVTSTEWQSSVSTPRTILRAQFSKSGPIAGAAQPLEDFDEEIEAFCGLDSEAWQSVVDVLQNQSMGAPYPASMVLVDDVLYVICDDGMLCALSDSTGDELWSFILPSACARLKYISSSSSNSLPWLSAGSLTAEETSDGEILLWCTLGAAGRGIVCLDVTDEEPSLVWAGEEFEDGSALWTHGGENTGLGLTAAAPLAATLSGELTLVLPAGPEASALLLYDAESGLPCGGTESIDDAELSLSPLGLVDSDGTLEQVVCCDDDGGVQFFELDGRDVTASSCIDLKGLCNSEGFEFVFSPMSSSTSRGLWLVFIAECDDGTFVASCSADDDDPSWSQVPWKGSGYGWWTLYDGFHDVISAFIYDGLLYLLGSEDGSKVLLIVDLTPGQLKVTVSVDDDAEEITVVDGTVVLLCSDGSVNSVTSLTGSYSPSKSVILYTLQRQDF